MAVSHRCRPFLSSRASIAGASRALTFAVVGLLLAGCPEPTQGPASPDPSYSAVPTLEPTDGKESLDPTRPKAEPFPVPESLQAIVDAPDRTPEDRALDPGRHPAEMLAFFGVEPGMRVAELAAGSGYTAELLARSVGSEGVVYGHNTPFILDRFAEQPWSARLEKPVMANVVRLDREFDDPFPADVKNLDGVFVILFYHDTYWMEIDRTAMNQAVFDALKPGGIYGIVDHSAAKGAGGTVTESLHRVEEATVRAELEAVGFELEAEASFLRNPSDALDWNAQPSAAGARRGTSDRFVLRFRKPS